jgi:uroporphyrin-III C-methyltransferase
MGKVFLIGAGPGDPELMTLKAARALGQAGVVRFARSNALAPQARAA